MEDSELAAPAPKNITEADVIIGIRLKELVSAAHGMVHWDRHKAARLESRGIIWSGVANPGKVTVKLPVKLSTGEKTSNM